MRQLLSVLVALSFALSLSTAALAETKAEPAVPAGPAKPAEPMKGVPAEKAEPAKKAEPGKKAQTRKAKSRQITGVVGAVDDASGTLTVKGRKTSISLKVGDEVKLSKIHVGDKVLVQYRGDTAYSVKKVTTKRAASGKTAKQKTAPATAPAGK